MSPLLRLLFVALLRHPRGSLLEELLRRRERPGEFILRVAKLLSAPHHLRARLAGSHVHVSLVHSLDVSGGLTTVYTLRYTWRYVWWCTRRRQWW